MPLKLNHALSNGAPLLWWLDPAAVLESSTDLQNWRPASTPGSPARVEPAGLREFFRLRK